MLGMEQFLGGEVAVSFQVKQFRSESSAVLIFLLYRTLA